MSTSWDPWTDRSLSRLRHDNLPMTRSLGRLRQANLLAPLAGVAAKLLQLYLTLCDPIDGSPPGSPVPGIFQARTLEWVAISFSNA